MILNQLLAHLSKAQVRSQTFYIFNFLKTAEGIYTKFGTNVPYQILTKYCYFFTVSGSKIQYGRLALASDWPTHFKLLENGQRDLLQTWHKCSLQGSGQVLFI